MKKAIKKTRRPEMLKEYDFRGAVRGKYAAATPKAQHRHPLPDVAEFFPDSAPQTKPSAPLSRPPPHQARKTKPKSAVNVFSR